MQTFLRTQPRIEAFLNKDASLSIELRTNQLNTAIIQYYGIELPIGLIGIIIEFENSGNVIHHQYQQYVAPKLLTDHYPRTLLSTYKIINYTSSIIALCASFYHLHRWLNQAATTNSDALPSTAIISTINHYETSINTPKPTDTLPKFLTLFPIPGSLTLFNKISPNLFSTQYHKLYPSIYSIVPIFAIWTSLELVKNLIFFNTNRNIQKLSYFMPIDVKTKSITNALFNDWNEFLFTDNYGLSPKRFVSSYTNDMHSIFDGNNDENIRLVFVDEHDQGSHVNFDRERGQRMHSPQSSIIVPSPKYALKNNKLPLPNLRHFVLQQNTLFALIMLHSTLLPISRCLLKFNHLFLPNATRPNTKRFASLQSITSHRNESLDNVTSGLMKVSNIISSHAYCLLHVVATSIVPVICLR